MFKKSRKKLAKHFKGLGFTNRLAIYILLFLAAGLAGGFILAWRSITYGYTGALACWTICFSPLATVASIVLGKVVEKNKQENTGADGEGIVFAAAKSQGFTRNIDSPAI